jgi:peptidoglycan hydrolase-like protein with peptidoglycan-binding domain
VRQSPAAPGQQPKVYQTPADVREAYLDTGTRAQSQRWLSALGYGTGGADGVFGPRTRAAIAAWQRSAGYAPDGYLTRKQYRELRQSARFAEARSREYVARQRARRDRYYNDGYGVYEGPVDGYYLEGPVGGGYGPSGDLTISGPGY